MNRLTNTLLISALLLAAIPATCLSAPPDHFVTSWKTDNPGASGDTSITLPMVGGPYDVDWDGDGIFDEFGLTGTVTHDYGVAGTYTLRIQGSYDSILVPLSDDEKKIVSVDQWGSNVWTTMYAAFQRASNLVVSATDTPDFSAVTDMSHMFASASSANPDTSGWDTSSVTDMSYMFYNASSANPDTSGWDTGSVTNMSYMFRNYYGSNSSANPDTSGWDTRSVTNMSYMFDGASSANPDTSGWDTSLVRDMEGMFWNASSANPDTSGWDTGSVTNMSSMFWNASSANPDTSGWDTGSVTGMSHMFDEASSANPDTSGWDTSSVTDMSYMFQGASRANPDTSGWDTSSVTSMSVMFSGASRANPDTSGWDTSSVTSMSVMFSGASSANPDTSGWDTRSVTSMSHMFWNASSANPDTSGWDTRSVTDMSFMFLDATSANPDTSGWDTRSVRQMPAMFANALSANPDTSGWDTRSVTNMSGMFYNASSANPDTSGWNVARLVSANSMFSGAGLSTAHYDALLSSWGSQSVQSGVVFDGGASVYCSDAAANARDVLTNTHGWTITDGGRCDTPSDHFVTSWKTDNPGATGETSIRLPMMGGPYDVDWDGDGIFDEFGLYGIVTHDYGVAGTYTVRIQGSYDSIRLDVSNNEQKIVSVDQWGSNRWTTMTAAFHGARNLVISATDTPDFSAVTDMSKMFSYSSANPDTSGWDTSSVTDMSYMFYFASIANPDTSGWDTSSVTNMSYMFGNDVFAYRANPNTSGWDTGSVTDMSFMFQDASSANPDTSGWDTRSVTNMSSMFSGASSANPDTSGWDTGSVTDMSGMFSSASSANPDTSGWDTSLVRDMEGMFWGATSANPDTSGWDTRSVTDISGMFAYAYSANPDMSGWNVASLRSAGWMFWVARLSTAHYDALLSSWGSQSVQAGVVFDGGASVYCSNTAANARDVLTNTHGWTITDGGRCDTPPDIEYAAIGDAASSGEGHGPYIAGTNNNLTQENLCHRANHAYSQASNGFVEAFIPGANVNRDAFLACSGAKTVNVQVNGTGQWDEVAQLDDPRIGIETDLVTLTLGINDLGFSSIVDRCLLPLDCQDWSLPPLTNTLGQAMPALVTNHVEPAVLETLIEIKTIAPEATVLILGYPLLVDPGNSACLALDPIWADISSNDRQFFEDTRVLLNDAIERTAATAGVHFVPTSDHFLGHELCTDSTAFVGLPLNPDLMLDASSRQQVFQPNASGHKRFAEAVFDKLVELRQSGHPFKANGLPENPAPVPANGNTVAPPPFMLDELHFESQGAPFCPASEITIPGSSVSVTGAEFTAMTTLTVTIESAGQSSATLPSIQTDAMGAFDEIVVIPGNTVPSYPVILQIHGNGANGAPRILAASLPLVDAASGDTDLDSVLDSCDNCPDDMNADQLDSDFDGIGDACDVCPIDAEDDLDGDGICHSEDPCPFDPDNKVSSGGQCPGLNLIFWDEFER